MNYDTGWFVDLLGRSAYSSSQANMFVFSRAELRSPASGNLALSILVRIRVQVCIHVCQTN